MNDMTSVIVPKSDQINADDLITGPITITIRDVQIKGGQEQPVSIYFDGSDKAFRPCKSMSRVLVAAWGPDAKEYVGRSLTLYRDPTVKWGGLEVGGIRISHMTDIERDMTLALTATKGSRKPYTVRRMVAPAVQATDPASKYTAGYIAEIEKTTVADALESLVLRQADKLEKLRAKRADLAGQIDFAISQKRSELGGDDFKTDFELEPEGPADEDRGEANTDDAGDLLAEAKKSVDKAKSADAVVTIQDEYRERLSPGDQLALSTHAMATVSAKWPEV